MRVGHNSLSKHDGSDQVAADYILNGVLRARWNVNEAGTTINDSLNVSSYTDTSTGDGDANITNAFASTTGLITTTHPDFATSGAGFSTRECYIKTDTTSQFNDTRALSNAGADAWMYDQMRISAVCGDLA